MACSKVIFTFTLTRRNGGWDRNDNWWHRKCGCCCISPCYLPELPVVCTWDRLLLRAACFCLFSLRRFQILVAFVDFLFDTKHEHFGCGGNRLCFFYVEIKWFSCLPSTLQRTTFTSSAIQNSRAPCKSERENWISSVLDGWRSILRRCVSFAEYSGTCLGRLSHCAFSQPEAFILWTLTFHWCIDRSMQILNERESRICCWLTVTLQYTYCIKSNSIAQYLTKAPRYVWHSSLHVSARLDQRLGEHVTCEVIIDKFYI